ncbi:MAG: hypothetical protein SGARI_001899 [Bacillariaceae sp.]
MNTSFAYTPATGAPAPAGGMNAGDPRQAAYWKQQTQLQLSMLSRGIAPVDPARMLGNLVENSPQRPLRNKRGAAVPSINDKDMARVLAAVRDKRFQISIEGKNVRFGSLKEANRPGTYCGLVMKDSEEKEYVGWGEMSTKHLLYKSVKTAKVLCIDPNDVRLMCGPNRFHDDVRDRLVREVMKTTEAPSALLRLQYLCTPSNLMVGNICQDLLQQLERRLQEQDEKNNKKFLSKVDAESKYQTKEDAESTFANYDTSEQVDAKIKAALQNDPRLQQLPQMSHHLQQFGNWYTNQCPQMAQQLQQFQQACPQLQQIYHAGPQLYQMHQSCERLEQAGPHLNQMQQTVQEHSQTIKEHGRRWDQQEQENNRMQQTVQENSRRWDQQEQTNRAILRLAL